MNLDPPVALTVAGTDSGGAAGIAADLTAIAAHGAHGACVVTAVTAQDTTGVHDNAPIPIATVASQLDAVLDDLPVTAAKTGMLASPAVVELVADRLSGLAGVPVVVDPVLRATSGAVLGDAAMIRAYQRVLLPHAAVATPNLDEARALTGADAPADQLAARLADLGCAVVVTGGPDPQETSPRSFPVVCTDWVALPGQPPVPLRHPAVATRNDHGTGCTFSAALAVHLGHGVDLLSAVRRAQAFVSAALATSATWRLGRGRGPVAHVLPTLVQPTHQEE